MDLSGLKVLIVEDEAFVALDLEDTLESAGAQIVGVATSPAEALSLIRKSHVSVAVLDVNLGPESSQAVAEQLNVDGVPYIFHTSNTVRFEWMKAPIVAKPCNREDLLINLTAVLDSQDAGRNGRHAQARC